MLVGGERIITLVHDGLRLNIAHDQHHGAGANGISVESLGDCKQMYGSSTDKFGDGSFMVTVRKVLELGIATSLSKMPVDKTVELHSCQNVDNVGKKAIPLSTCNDEMSRLVDDSLAHQKLLEQPVQRSVEYGLTDAQEGDRTCTAVDVEIGAKVLLSYTSLATIHEDKVFVVLKQNACHDALHVVMDVAAGMQLVAVVVPIVDGGEVDVLDGAVPVPKDGGDEGEVLFATDVLIGVAIPMFVVGQHGVIAICIAAAMHVDGLSDEMIAMPCAV